MVEQKRTFLLVAALLMGLGKLACGGPPIPGSHGVFVGPAKDDPETGGDDATNGGEEQVPAECGDTKSSTDNCGKCGHKCNEGSCEAGRCQPIVLATDEAAPRGITVANGTVYWVAEGIDTQGSIRALSAGEKSPRTIADSLGAPIDIVHSNGTLFWTNWFDGRAVMAVEASGGTPRTVVNSPSGGAELIAIGGDRIYWSVNPMISGSKHFIYSVTRDGNDRREHAQLDDQHFGGPAAANGKVYWSQRTNPGSIMEASTDAVAKSVLADQGTPNLLVADGDSLYWAVEAPTSKVLKMPLAGGTPTVLVESLGQVGALAVDATNLYVSNAADRTIVSIPKAGGGPTTLVTSDQYPVRLFVDDSFVYWTFRAKDKKGGVAKVSK